MRQRSAHHLLRRLGLAALLERHRAERRLVVGLLARRFLLERAATALALRRHRSRRRRPRRSRRCRFRREPAAHPRRVVRAQHRLHRRHPRHHRRTQPEPIDRHPERQLLRNALLPRRRLGIDHRLLADRDPRGHARRDLELEPDTLDGAIDRLHRFAGAQPHLRDPRPSRARTAPPPPRFPSPATVGGTAIRCCHAPSAVRPRATSSPPAGASASAHRSGAPANRSGSRAGACSTSALPSTTRSTTSGAAVRAQMRRAARSGSSPRPMITSTPRPARAAGPVNERFTAEPTPTVCSRDAARQRPQHVGDDLALEPDRAVGHEHDLPLRLRAQRRQRLHQRRRASPSIRSRAARAAICARPCASPRRSRAGLLAPAARLIRELDHLQAVTVAERIDERLHHAARLRQRLARHRSRGVDEKAQIPCHRRQRRAARRRHQRDEAIRVRRVRLARRRPRHIDRQPRRRRRHRPAHDEVAIEPRPRVVTEHDLARAVNGERVRRRLGAPPGGHRVANHQRQPRPRRQRRVGHVDASRVPTSGTRPARPCSAASPPSEIATPTRPRRASAASGRSISSATTSAPGGMLPISCVNRLERSCSTSAAERPVAIASSKRSRAAWRRSTSPTMRRRRW